MAILLPARGALARFVIMYSKEAVVKLHIDSTKVQDGSVAVRWTVSEETLKVLEQMGCSNPQVLLITAPNRNNGYSGRRESRKIVPLSDLVAYVDFRAPGENNIFAIIMRETPRVLKHRYLSRSGGSYDTYVLDDEEEEFLLHYTHFDDSHLSPHRSDTLTVDVPKECFAKEPAEWEKKWVNWFFRQPAVDKCEFRRRRMVAYTFQPIIFLIVLALMTAVSWGGILALTLVGMRGVNYRGLVRPMDMFDGSGSTDLWFGDLHGSYFLPRTKRRWTDLALLPFMPFIPLLWFLILKFGFKLHTAEAALFTIAGVMVFAATLTLTGIVLVWLEKRYNNNTASPPAKPLISPPWYRRDKLLLDGKVSVEDLLKQRRTIRLVFAGIKAKVCRPFAS